MLKTNPPRHYLYKSNVLSSGPDSQKKGFYDLTLSDIGDLLNHQDNRGKLKAVKGHSPPSGTFGGLVRQYVSQSDAPYSHA